jgi:phi13 family phage major tail protein
MSNYKSVLGVDMLYYALVTQDTAAGYVAGTPAYLAPLANVSVKPKTSSKMQYFDNVAMESLLSEGESEGEIEIQGLPLDLKATLLGKTWDSTNKRMYDDGGIPPYVALGYRALKSDGNYIYYWYLKCQFAPPDEEAATKADSPDPKTTKLKVTAIYTTYLFDVDGSNSRSVKKNEADTAITGVDVDTWFDAVQTPVPGSVSAVTCTPSPADGATNQTTSVAITLTFNNALAGGAENGIGLVRSDTMAAISVTRSVNAARTVVTLEHSALTSAKTYLIVVTGVRDISGQALADVVYDFATA